MCGKWEPELRSAVGSPAFFVLLWNSHRAGALYLRSTRSRTRVAQKGRLLPQWAPFPSCDGLSHIKARNPLGLTFALKLAPAFPWRSHPVGRRHFDKIARPRAPLRSAVLSSGKPAPSLQHAAALKISLGISLRPATLSMVRDREAHEARILGDILVAGLCLVPRPRKGQDGPTVERQSGAGRAN